MSTLIDGDDEEKKQEESSKQLLQRNVKLIENWYQSYYMWNMSYLSCMQSRPPPIYHSASPHLVFRSSTYVLNSNNNSNIRQSSSAARPQRARGDESRAAHMRVYKVPSLGRRFCAELLDAFYIQIIKIIIAIALLNYTDIL